MAHIRTFAIGLLVGGLLGLWIGINIGSGQDLFVLPFG
jgi:hypothetical protein